CISPADFRALWMSCAGRSWQGTSACQLTPGGGAKPATRALVVHTASSQLRARGAGKSAPGGVAALALSSALDLPHGHTGSQAYHRVASRLPRSSPRLPV